MNDSDDSSECEGEDDREAAMPVIPALVNYEKQIIEGSMLANDKKVSAKVYEKSKEGNTETGITDKLGVKVAQSNINDFFFKQANMAGKINYKSVAQS